MARRCVLFTLGVLTSLITILVSCASGTITTTAPQTTSGTPATTSAASVTSTDTVNITVKKVDGTVVQRTLEKPKYGGTFVGVTTAEGTVFDCAVGFLVQAMNLFQTNNALITGDWRRGPLGTNETNWWIGGKYHITLSGPELAESWEMPDDSTIICHMRKGVHFALSPNSEASRLVNGREVTAEDAAWSIAREWASPRSWPRSTTLPQDALISARAIDKYTVELKVPPHVQGLHFFLTVDGIFIIPHEVVDKYGDMSDWHNNVGTGPFMLTDYVPASSLTFVRNPNYFERNPLLPDDQLPYVDKQVLLVIPDLSTQLAAFRTAKIDMMQSVGSEDSQSLSKSIPQLVRMKKTQTAMAIAGRIDKQDLPFKDVRVRRALNMALNKQKMVDGYYKGDAQLYAYPFPDDAGNRPFYTPFEKLSALAQETFTYEPDKAKQLLTEAGYPNSFKTQVMCSNVGDQVDVLSIVREDFLKVGVDMEIKPVESGVYSSVIRNRSNPEMIYCGSMMNQTTVKFMELRIESADDHAYFESPETRAAYNRINPLVGKDDATSDRILREITPFLLENPWGVFLPMPYNYDVWWPWVKHYEGQANIGAWNLVYQRYLWIDQSLKKSVGH